jgi:hypothetical protein
VLGLLFVVVCLWNGWHVLVRGLASASAAPQPEPAWLGAIISLVLAVTFGVVTFRIPAGGFGTSGISCGQQGHCFLNYGNSRFELGLATVAFLVDTLLFGAVGVWTARGSDGDSE